MKRIYTVERVGEAGQNQYGLCNHVDGSDHLVFEHISLEELKEYLWMIETKDTYMALAKPRPTETEA
jgi:hypothetical protein